MACHITERVMMSAIIDLFCTRLTTPERLNEKV